MKISVVMVAFNSARTIRYAIESFLAQTYRDAELVIVDGASTDNTVAIAESYRDSRIRVYSEPDEGIFFGMNKGLRLYRGDAIGYLNSDDCYHDGQVLARIAEALETHDIAIRSPARAPERASAAPRGTSPNNWTVTLSAPWVRSPPTSATPLGAANSCQPSAKASSQDSSARGKVRASSAQRGVAPMAARSLRFTAKAL